MPEFAAPRNRTSIYLAVIALVAVFVSGLVFFLGNPFDFACFSSRPGGLTQSIGLRDLQRALDRAQPGDVLLLDPKEIYTGHPCPAVAYPDRRF